MADINLLAFGTSCFLFGVSLFCANLLLLRGPHNFIYRPLALFCGIEAALQLPEIIYQGFIAPAPVPSALIVTSALSVPLSMMMAPLFWLYVRRMTAEEDEGELPWKVLHLAPILLALVLAAAFALNHNAVIAAIDHPESTASPAIAALNAGLLALSLVFHLQVAAYITLIFRRISTYRTRLKDLFASTEDRELHWITWIVIAIGLYLALGLVLLLGEATGVSVLPLDQGPSETLDLALGTTVIWIVSIWGTRQKPGLYRAEESQKPRAAPDEEPGAKYERSALTPEHAQRIAGKIKAAMERDLLYRDPNLSLWGLASHIGVTSNYVSQTLNETLGESFFDHVNKWRVRDAIRQLTTTDQTILAVAYDVGFNSRSPFYKAFKRETGMTPTELRDKTGPYPALPPGRAMVTGE